MTKIYIDMVADLFHAGHVEILKNAKQFGDYLIVGIHNDQTVQNYKRRPIMTMDERIAVVKACKYVDEVISDAPLKVTKEYLNKHGITKVIHGNDLTEESKNNMYGDIIEMLIVLPYTPNISTTDIIKRIFERH